MPALTALLRFSQVPAIYFCHGWHPQEESPLHFPRILRYVAVSQACYDRLIANGIAETKIQILLNFVDLERFQPRGPLPSKPKNALIFSNEANEQNVIPIIRQACAQQGIHLNVVGVGTNNSTDVPEHILEEYDIVFAVGKSALEALAVGTAVIVCDYGKIGPLVSMGNVHQMRQLNFGLRSLINPLTTEAVLREIALYDRDDVHQVSKFIRQDACKNQCIEQLIMLYKDVIHEYKTVRLSLSIGSELNAASQYLQSVSDNLRTSAIEEKFQKIDVEMEKFQTLDNDIKNLGKEFKNLDTQIKIFDDNLQILDRKIAVVSKIYQSISRFPIIGSLIKLIKQKCA